MTPDELRSIFTYHAPSADQGERYQRLRSEAHSFAKTINALCPDSPEKTLAIRDLQRCVMMANASIAIRENPA